MRFITSLALLCGVAAGCGGADPNGPDDPDAGPPPADDAWWRQVGGAEGDDVHDVAASVDGDVLVTGGFRATVDFGDGPATVSVLEDAFVAKYAADGTLRWMRHAGSSQTASDN